MDLNQYLDPSIIASLQTGGYIIMLALMIIEGPIVTFIAAFLASLGVFDIWLVLLFGWLGDVLGDFLFYSIGRFGLHIFQKKTTVDTPKEVSFIGKLDHLIHKNLALAILIIKFTPYAPPIGLTYIGKIRVSFRKYLITSMILCVPTPLIATLIGYHIGLINSLIQKYSWMTLLWLLSWVFWVIVLLIWIFFFLRRKTESILQSEKLH